VNHEKLRFRVRSATVGDAGAVAACVNAAYRHYVERIGKAPGPMLEDYNQVITERQVLVADREGAILGVLVLAATEEGFLLDNVAVYPCIRVQALEEHFLRLLSLKLGARGTKPSTYTPM